MVGGTVMSLSNQTIGKVVQWLGWFSVAHSLWTYGFALLDANSDASIRAYAWLIAIEGIFFLGAGLLVVWLGRRIARPAQVPEPVQAENRGAE